MQQVIEPCLPYTLTNKNTMHIVIKRPPELAGAQPVIVSSRRKMSGNMVSTMHIYLCKGVRNREKFMSCPTLAAEGGLGTEFT